MKKSLFTFALSVCSICIGFSQITVSGTGCNPFGFAPVDGMYTQNGTQNGKNTYIDQNANHQIEWTGSQWIIEFGNSETLYTNPNDVGVDPPLTGWSTGVGDCSGRPAPTMTFGLPVELIYFKIEEKNEIVRLNWKTASELNNDRFEIEVSQSGKEFKKIGVVQGMGTTAQEQYYSFKIENLLLGISYFRLKQVDFDGQFEYSNVVSLDFTDSNQQFGKFYPNPSQSGIVHMDYIAQNEKDLSVSVFDLSGKLMANQLFRAPREVNHLTFDFSDLNPGIYLAKIGGERNSTYQKLIIKK